MKRVSDSIQSVLQNISETRGNLDYRQQFYGVKVLFMFQHSYGSNVWIFFRFFPALSAPCPRKTCLLVSLNISATILLKESNNLLISSLCSTRKKTQKLTTRFERSDRAQVCLLFKVRKKGWRAWSDSCLERRDITLNATVSCDAK